MAMLKQIYLAGGCFWGVEEYFSLIPGVADATSGYANGRTENPSYDDVCHRNTGHAETVRVTYDPSVISLKTLVEQLFEIIDPLSVNRQGNDFGTQYRTGVYYTDESDRAVIEAVFAQEQKKHDAPIATELAPLEQFYAAEECHQDYLRKNPGGYCHVNFDGLAKVKSEAQKRREAAGGLVSARYVRPDEAELRRRLTRQQYNITQHGGTEPAFSGVYDDFFEPGIYVDVVTGQPVFSSFDKYDAHCGWPAFTRPIDEDAVKKYDDKRFGLHRVEVKSSGAESHLGHVFHDGPSATGGLRYCINSAALRFIAKDDLVAEGYAEYIDRC